MIRWYCIALFCFNYHLQYFVLCIWVDNLLAISLTSSHACLCGLTVAARTMLHAYAHAMPRTMRYIACANNFMVYYLCDMDASVISGLMTSHLWQIDTTRLWTVWGLHMSTIKWGLLMLAHLPEMEGWKTICAKEERIGPPSADQDPDMATLSSPCR